ncbi:MAG: thioesterase family protein [Pseudomonadota bacterium]
MPEDIDELNHVNNAVYVKWIQDAAVGHWTAASGIGVPEKVVWVCSRHEVDYKDQLREGDDVEIRTWLGLPKGIRFPRYTDIRRIGAGKPAVQAMTIWVVVDKATQKPRRIDSSVLELFGLETD